MSCVKYTLVYRRTCTLNRHSSQNSDVTLSLQISFDVQVIKEISFFMMHNMSDFDQPLTSAKGRAVAQVVSCWLPTAAAWVRVRAEHVGFVVEKRHWGRFSLSTNFSIIIIAWRWHNRPIGGRSAEWTQLDSTPHYTN
jgi:hypothetical protein